MKKRVISALVMLIILIPILFKGGFIFNAIVYAIALLGLKEFLDIKQTKKRLPSFIVFISFIMMTLFMLRNLNNNGIVYAVDFRIIAGLFIAYLLPVVMFHDRSKYSINDAFYLIGSIFFLGTSFHSFVLLRNAGLEITIYLLLIAICTDTYAYLTGSLIGKHKLLEEISPKKTWEGMIGGTIFGSLISSYYFYLVINPNFNIFTIIGISLFLSVVGQFGDLVFSSIKRYFKAKDFSNLIPGHGGVLDRCDSLIFIALGFMFFITII